MSAFDPFSIPQIIGYIAVISGIFALLQKDDDRMKILLGVTATILCVHFVLLSYYIAAFSVFLAGSRAVLSIFDFVKKRAHFFAIFYGVLALALFFTAYQRPLDILPLIAAFNGIYCFFYLKGIKLRIFMGLGQCLWITHNILALSYGPFILEAILFSANVFTIMKLRPKKKPEETPGLL